jgi:hypothetical protein
VVNSRGLVLKLAARPTNHDNALREIQTRSDRFTPFLVATGQSQEAFDEEKYVID